MASTTTEEPREIDLGAERVAYVLRRSARSRGLRVTIDPRRGVIVSIPLRSRRGWAHPDREIERFLRERQGWVVRHLARLERQRAELATLGGLADGASIRYRGALHRLRIVAPREAKPPNRRSSVERVGGESGDEIVVRLGTHDRRSVRAVLEAWFRQRASEAIERAVGLHAPALGVQPSEVVLRDPETRWGSASKKGRVMLSWRLVLAPAEVLETVVVHELAHLRVFGHGPRFWAVVAARVPDHEERRRWLRRHAHELHGALAE